MKTAPIFKLLLLSAVLPLHFAVAQNYWINTDGTAAAWKSGTNWSEGSEPVTGEIVRIRNGHTAWVGANFGETATSGSLFVGSEGASGGLLISNSSTLTAISIGIGGGAGNGADATGANSSGTVTVTGSGSVLSATSTAGVTYTLAVGGWAAGTQGVLEIKNGGKVELASGNMSIGLGTGATGSGSVLVTGSGSSLVGTATILRIGHQSYGEITIEDRATVNIGSVVVGASRGMATISGSAALTANGTLTVTNGTMNISTGGTVNVAGSTANIEIQNANSALAVDGPNSKLSNSGASYLMVGNTNDAKMTITNGGAVSVGVGYIGRYDNMGGSGNILVSGTAPNGTASTWTIAGYLVMGTGTTQSTLTITNGGKVSNGLGAVGATHSGPAYGSGLVLVDGAGSEWSSTTLYVGGGYNFSGTVLTGGTGIVDIQNNGTVTVGTGGSGTVTLARYEGSVGTINIGGTSGTAAAGTLNAAVVIGGSGTATVNFNQVGNTIFEVKLSGNLSVTHNSTGTTTLTADNDYTGETYVNAGKLIVATGASIAGDVTIAEGGTLGGAGTIGGFVTVNEGGILDASSLTFASGLTISTGSILDFTTSDTIFVTSGTLTLQAGVTLNLSGTGTYVLFDYNGADLAQTRSRSATGVWDTWDLGVYGGDDYIRTWSNEAGILALTVEPIPEPGTWAMMLGGLGVLASIQRLRRR